MFGDTVIHFNALNDVLTGIRWLIPFLILSLRFVVFMEGERSSCSRILPIKVVSIVLISFLNVPWYDTPKFLRKLLNVLFFELKDLKGICLLMFAVI